jgi:hypothetical protein
LLVTLQEIPIFGINYHIFTIILSKREGAKLCRFYEKMGEKRKSVKFLGVPAPRAGFQKLN